MAIYRPSYDRRPLGQIALGVGLLLVPVLILATVAWLIPEARMVLLALAGITVGAGCLVGGLCLLFGD